MDFLSERLVRISGVWARAKYAALDHNVISEVIEQDAYGMRHIGRFDTLIDIGAHIGTFSYLAHLKCPSAKIVACECCPDNLSCLVKNVGSFATIMPVAVSYCKENLALLNSILKDKPSRATGGSILCIVDENGIKCRTWGDYQNSKVVSPSSGYWVDRRTIIAKTLEEVMDENRIHRVDLLKIDCEGCEMELFEKTTSLDKIKQIVGEWHNRNHFVSMIKTRFKRWQRIDNGSGLFWLINPDYYEGRRSVRIF